jgi:hypothetical protein
MRPDQCFAKLDGKIKAILNWRLRQKEDDIVIAEELNTKEFNLYNEFKKSGKNDISIFNDLFPQKVESKQVLIEIDKLTKKQLIHLIINKMKISLPSLKNMSTEDLRALFVKL